MRPFADGDSDEIPDWFNGANGEAAHLILSMAWMHSASDDAARGAVAVAMSIVNRTGPDVVEPLERIAALVAEAETLDDEKGAAVAIFNKANGTHFGPDSWQALRDQFRSDAIAEAEHLAFSRTPRHLKAV